MMLTITNLHAEIEGKKILNGLSLEVGAGEVHAIMGPNGSGKSTLAQLLAGRDVYTVTEGEVLYDGRDLLAMPSSSPSSIRSSCRASRTRTSSRPRSTRSAVTAGSKRWTPSTSSSPRAPR
jgi:ABC-type cobalamin/Fe3+-siderophores transport system ATPase subunit